ncbi:MAG: c-type cytochrome [Bryobacteraceae bacterium]
MPRTRYSLILVPALLCAQAGPPPAAQRGREFFFDKGPKCATCHIAEGKGNKVGPDLTRIARVSPRGLKVAILSTVTEYVVTAKLKSKETFPAMRIEQTGDNIRLWDLSKTPPELRTLQTAELASYGGNATWKHPPASAGLTNAQLADIMSYIRYAAFRDTKGVAADELE